MVLWDTIATILSVFIGIGSLAYWLGKKFAKIDEKFAKIDKRFNQIEERFAQIDERFTRVDERFTGIDERLARIDERFAKIDERFNEVVNKIDRLATVMFRAMTETHEIVIDFLGLKGLIDLREANYLKDRVRGTIEVYSATLNPLTKEEIEFLRRLFSKEISKMTIEELNKAYELGIKILCQDYDYRGYTIAIGAAYIRAYLRQEKWKRQKLVKNE